MAKMPVSVATIVTKKEPIDSSKTATIIATPLDPPADKSDKTRPETIIIAKPKGPLDEEVPTKFVPLGAIITDGDEINFHKDITVPKLASQKNPATANKQIKTLEPIRRLQNNETVAEPVDPTVQAARMKELRLLSFGKKLLDSCKSGNAAEVKKFMLEGAPFISDWVGTTPLHYSVMNKHVEVTEILLKAGIYKDAKNKVDRTSLHVAAQMGLAYMVKLLLSYGADVNCRDMLNMTPLHWAAECGDLLTAKILLDYGADTSVVNKFGKTASRLAEKNNFLDILKEIEETERLHPDERMMKVCRLQQKNFPTSKPGIIPVAEILEPKQTDEKLDSPTKTKKVVLVTKETPEGDACRGTVHFSSDNEPDNEVLPPTKNTSGEMSADSAMKLLKSHGVRMIEPDKDTVISSAILNGHTIRLTDAGKLAFSSLGNNLPIDERNHEQVLSSELDSSDFFEGPPSKISKLMNGQKMHQINAQQLIDMKKDNKFVIKGGSIQEMSSCTIERIPPRGTPPSENGTTDINHPSDTDDPSLKNNSIYLQRLENKAQLYLRQIELLKRQLRVKEEEYSGIRKQIEMFKTCSNLT